MIVKKAIFPVAGLGAHFLPATKTIPKEMMPIVDMPLIQYAVNEAVEAGITELIFVTNTRKRAIEDYFDTNLELEDNLFKSNKYELLNLIRNILPRDVSCCYIHQSSAQGLGHAVLCAKNMIGNEPFAVLLADDLIETTTHSCLQQLLANFKVTQSSIVAVQPIALSEVKKHGIIAMPPGNAILAKINGIIEKPSQASAPSNMAVIGRYILTPSIFTLLETIQKDSEHKIQLTDAIAKLLLEEPVYSLQFEGRRFDCGSKLGYLEATVAWALKHPTLAEDFKTIARKVLALQ